MNRVVFVQPQNNFILRIRFADGMTKHIDVRPFIGDGISAQLADQEYFQRVAIDEGGGIFWPNGYDFCPEFLHEDVPEIIPV